MIIYRGHRIMFFLLILATMLATSSSSIWSPSDGEYSGERQPLAQTNDIEDHTWHVYVINGMNANRILLVHCKSRDDDLGIHNLTVGTAFEWKFRPNIFGSTLYWCYVASDDFGHAAFNVWWDNDPEFFHKCNQRWCYWAAKDDGIYLANIPDEHDEFFYKWEPGRLVVANSTM